VDAELGRREGEDEPPLARVDMLPTEGVTEYRPERLGLRGIEQDVSTDDSHGHLRG
jgi:hypothetical protein